MQPWRPFQLPLLPFPGPCALTPAVLALHILWTHDTCSSLLTCALVPLPGAFLTTSPNCDIFSVQMSSSPRAFGLLNPHYPTQSALSSCSLLYSLSRTFYCFVGFFTLFLPSSLQGGALALLFGASPKAQETGVETTADGVSEVGTLPYSRDSAPLALNGLHHFYVSLAPQPITLLIHSNTQILSSGKFTKYTFSRTI